MQYFDGIDDVSEEIDISKRQVHRKSVIFFTTVIF